MMAMISPLVVLMRLSFAEGEPYGAGGILSVPPDARCVKHPADNLANKLAYK